MKKIHSTKAGLVLFFIVVFFSTPLVFAYDNDTERRINIGLKLFRILLAADTHLSQKTDNNQLNLLFISATETSSAQRYADKLLTIGAGDKKGKIHNIPIHVSAITLSQLQKSPLPQLAGIYIVDKLSSQQLKTLINYGISHSIIVYSPFDGDVQAGILAGLAIGIRVRPFINQKTLKKSQLIINPLFLKVAKMYED